MTVTLVVEKSEAPVVRPHVPICGAETVVGRQRDCTLRIPSAEVSRRHCILRYQADVLTVEDLDSLNGTFVNGERTTGLHELHPGDRLEIGPVVFAVAYEGVVVPARAAVAPDASNSGESATVNVKASHLPDPLPDTHADVLHPDVMTQVEN